MGRGGSEHDRGGYLVRPLQVRSAVATQFIQADASTGMDAFWVTVNPGFRLRWLGARSI